MCIASIQEVEALKALSSALTTLIKAQAMKYVRVEIAKRTVLASLVSPLAPIAWLQIGQIIGNFRFCIEYNYLC